MRKCIAIMAVLSICAGMSAKTEKKPLYKDSNAPIEKRVDDLMKRMSFGEKFFQLQNGFYGLNDEFTTKGMFPEGRSLGTAHNPWDDCWNVAWKNDSIIKYALDSTKLGIPVILGVEGIQGLCQKGATIYPHAIAQASSFDPSLVERMAYASGEEANAVGYSQILAPVLDIAREQRWGRIEETYGEDPYLIYRMGKSFIEGYRKAGLGCTLKHFVAHGSPVGGLNCASVSGGERELWSVYMYPFQKLISEMNPECVMSCYSSYDGVPVSASKYYLTDILRDKLGFKGYVYSDWNAVGRLENFHYTSKDNRAAGLAAIKAGVDLEVGFGAYFWTLEDQVNEGLLDKSYIERSARRVLEAKFRMGLFDKRPDIDTSRLSEKLRSSEHIALSKEIARESAILLENNGILPLDLSKYKSIAVVGPNSKQTVMGDYSWTEPFDQEGVNLYEGIRSYVGDKATVRQEDGCDWWSQDDSQISKAVELVKQSDLAIVAIGTRSTYIVKKPINATAGEGRELSSLDLPGRQLDLLKAIKATGKPMVVVFITGKPLALPWVKDNADAILLQWYAGEKQGEVAAEVLFGEVNPSGRLAVSMPRSTGTTPCYYNYYRSDKEYGTDLAGSPDKPNTRYIFEAPYALWEFGYGLSYTTFSYSNLNLNKTEFNSESETIVASCEVENTGECEGKEVIQLYVADPVSSVLTPVRQLKGFEKISLKPGEKKTVRIEVPVSELALYDEQMNCVVEPGEFEIQIGRSSGRIELRQTITYCPPEKKKAKPDKVKVK